MTTPTLTPSLSIYPLGSEITCSAGGYPPPSYQWQSAEDASGVSEACWRDITGETRKAFKSSMTKEHNVYRCAAVNSIRGRSFVAYSQRFQVNDKPGDTGIPVLLIIVNI